MARFKKLLLALLLVSLLPIPVAADEKQDSPFTGVFALVGWCDEPRVPGFLRPSCLNGMHSYLITEIVLSQQGKRLCGFWNAVWGNKVPGGAIVGFVEGNTATISYTTDFVEKSAAPVATLVLGGSKLAWHTSPKSIIYEPDGSYEQLANHRVERFSSQCPDFESLPQQIENYELEGIDRKQLVHGFTLKAQDPADSFPPVPNPTRIVLTTGSREEKYVDTRNDRGVAPRLLEVSNQSNTPWVVEVVPGGNPFGKYCLKDSYLEKEAISIVPRQMLRVGSNYKFAVCRNMKITMAPVAGQVPSQ